MAKNITLQVQIIGIPAVQRALARGSRVARQAVARALYVEGEKIMAESKLLVPVDTGVLRNSGHVQAHGRGDKFQVLVGYGGPSIPYAIVQHENTKFKHTVGEAKYLEKPAMKAARGMGKRVGSAVARDLKKLSKGK